MTVMCDKKTLFLLSGLLLFGVIILGFFYMSYFLPGKTTGLFPLQTGSTHPLLPPPDDAPLLDVTPLPEYLPGEQVFISGTTSLPSGEVLDIALIKEPFHTTKCDPGKFCGSNTYSTTVSAGPGSNVWSYSLNTTGFPEGGYDIWVVSRNQPNTSVHTALYLRECPRSENATP